MTEIIQEQADTRSAPPSLNRNTPLVSARNVTKKFGPQFALDRVTLEIFAGQTVGLLGPNGAGKSSMISLLTGLRRPDAGVVELFGRDPLTPAARSALGTTPQATAVPPTLRVNETISLVAAHYPDPVPTAELLEQFGLAAVAGKQCGALSGGQQRRLMVALALVGRPALVVLDEPTTGLDVEARDLLWQQLRDYRASGGTLLITSHYLAEIEALADRIVVIDQGRIIADGTVDEIKSHISLSHVRLRTTVPLDSLTSLESVVSGELSEHGITTLVSDDADNLVRRLVLAKMPFSDLQVNGATLEAAFLALTAKNDPGRPAHDASGTNSNRPVTQEF
ncbi:ATP-binding cassette domain-containing protein [Pseudarthrobacter psychrotolerans]|uniref:ATP-binding cassette domain-containing protein n=1 Tax=Pseudarthrobacter psychrotolerans TaxID=2697569 RepID=A0A6P1NN23_9MICC|nr:ABC transporter ATP-binding protein [Pseudarthrobacter psychrotolerans]QHK18942.1 ATP-binding cassette domain-containing protein [Pseudarthrobacter psychrotolerans]